MQVVVNSILTNYSRSGKGAVLLLLHGWGDSAKGLHKLQTDLSKQFDVITPDLPGFGSTEAPQEPWGLSDYADFVKAFMKKIDTKPVIVVGHSNGGAIAVRAIARGLNPEKLVLLASAGIRGEYKGRMKALRLVTKAGKALVSPLPKRVKNKLRRRVYTTVGSDMLVAEHLQETFKRVVEDDVRNDARSIKTQTLLVYGDQDVSTPLVFGKKLHDAIANSRLIVIPGGEHGIPLSHTSEIVTYIKDFAA